MPSRWKNHKQSHEASFRIHWSLTRQRRIMRDEAALGERHESRKSNADNRLEVYPRYFAGESGLNTDEIATSRLAIQAGNPIPENFFWAAQQAG
jgi:hypothetical protein